MKPFKAPAPEPLEHVTSYIERVVRAFESWVNEELKK